MLKREDVTLGCAVGGWVKTKQKQPAIVLESGRWPLLLDSSAMHFSATSELLWRDGAKAVRLVKG